MKTKFVLVLVVLFQMSSCQSDKKQETKELDTNDYRIAYTPYLELDKSGNQGTEFLLLSKKVNAADDFVENINLMIQNLEGMNLDLDKYAEITENQISSWKINFK